MYSLYRNNGKGSVQEEQLTQDDVRKEGKGRIRILIGKILVAKDRGEGYSKFQEKGEPLGSPFFCVVITNPCALVM